MNVSVAVLACAVEFFNSMVWVTKTDSTQLSVFDLILSQYFEKKVSFTILQKVLSSGRGFWFCFGLGFLGLSCLCVCLFIPGNTE